MVRTMQLRTRFTAVFTRVPLAAAALAVGIVTLTGPDPAAGYSYYSCVGDPLEWSSHEMTYRAGKKSFEPGPWRDALAAARDRWNESPGDITVKIQWNETSVALNNGENEIWFSTDQNLLKGAPARTLSMLNCGTMAEADIVFDVDWPYAAGTAKSSAKVYGGSNRMFRGVAVHEMGHGIGLCHVNTQYNIMGSDSTHVHANGGTLRNYAGEDAHNGAVFLYGLYPGGDIQDVSVSHWKYAGIKGEYSTHERTEIYNTSNEVLPATTEGGEPFFQVDKGQQVKVEFTYENSGESAQNVDIRYYLSSNDLITTLDAPLATGNIPNLVRNGAFTTNNTYLTIPNNLISGKKYYIGAIVNYNDKFNETIGANNATYIGILIN